MDGLGRRGRPLHRRLEGGTRTEDFPRLAISGSILLLFVSLGFVVTVHPGLLPPLAAEADVTIGLRYRVGQHVVAGTVIGGVWTRSPDEPRPSAAMFEESVLPDISIGFERTIEQDIGFGIRQQTDIACKFLSAAINDPYTAVQAIEHLAVVYCDLAIRPLGAKVLDGPGGRGRVVVPGSTFSEYVRFIGDVLGRYGGDDVSVMLAFVRLLRVCAEVLAAGSQRLDVLDVLDEAAVTVLADVERAMPRAGDIDRVRAAVTSLHHTISERRGREVAPAQRSR